MPPSTTTTESTTASQVPATQSPAEQLVQSQGDLTHEQVVQQITEAKRERKEQLDESPTIERVGSGIHKGRLIKEDGSIDYSSPSEREQREIDAAKAAEKAELDAAHKETAAREAALLNPPEPQNANDATAKNRAQRPQKVEEPKA